MQLNSVSPSYTYVAICYNPDFKGVYFRKFVVPKEMVVSNNGDNAAWYFLNNLDFEAVLIGCISWEDYNSLTTVKQDQI